MARPKLYDSSQPAMVRGMLWLYEFLASLKLAVVLILALALFLAFATFVEAHLGAQAVQWFLYHSHWFAGLLALLAINIFCAAAIRYPWKRHQTGFVVTHIGLLVLLAGSAISFMGSVNSQMLVFLNDTSQTAVDIDGPGFLQIEGLPGHPETFVKELDLGPFNWLSPHSVLIGSAPEERTPLTVYEDDQTKVEVIDYLSRSEVRFLPYLKLHFENRAFGAKFDLDFEWNSKLPFTQESFGMGTVMMTQTNDSEDLQRFQGCRPNRPVPEDGAIVVWAEGEAHQLDVAELQRLKNEEEGHYELDNGWKVELITYAPHADFQKLLQTGQLFTQGDDPQVPAVEFKVTVPAEEEGGEPTEVRLIRLAQYPLNTHASRLKDFYADFFHPVVEARVEILQGPEGKLAYRAWQSKQKMIVAQGDLEVGKEVDTFSMGGGDKVMRMTLDKYLTRENPEELSRVIGLPFHKNANNLPELKSNRIKVRVTWDESGQEKSEEFWLLRNVPAPHPAFPPESQRVFLPNNKMVNFSFNCNQTDVGFAMKLIDFDLKVDPGTKTAGNYTSNVLLLDLRKHPDVVALETKIGQTSDAEERQKQKEELENLRQEMFKKLFSEFDELSLAERDEWVASHAEADLQIVTMNEPMDYPDLNGRPLRFFQENYYPPDKAGNRPYGSVFRVNYDPGRSMKYLGSALITFGIFLMFYMRAYFFKRKPVVKKQAAPDLPEAAEPKLEQVSS